MKSLTVVEHDSVRFQDRPALLDDCVEDMNNRMRKNNLIFKGLPEEEKETWSETEILVSDFVKDKLGVTIGEIERAHHLGTRHPESYHPIIVKFLNFKSKDEVLQNAFS